MNMRLNLSPLALAIGGALTAVAGVSTAGRSAVTLNDGHIGLSES